VRVGSEGLLRNGRLDRYESRPSQRSHPLLKLHVEEAVWGVRVSAGWQEVWKTGGRTMAEEPLQKDAADHAEEMMSETALIIYHLFEEPQYFLEWGIKGAPFYLACVVGFASP
jgi:hypothetical protein